MVLSDLIMLISPTIGVKNRLIISALKKEILFPKEKKATIKPNNRYVKKINIYSSVLPNQMPPSLYVSKCAF